jgi:hypothetical protein
MARLCLVLVHSLLVPLLHNCPPLLAPRHRAGGLQHAPLPERAFLMGGC